mmetsp:Transcript_16635/g.32230  ORF Transcript_16635/g.32230 Transcript_16635/m.32230 type:complete len:137 (+) Transcript_16635:120-530(+)
MFAAGRQTARSAVPIVRLCFREASTSTNEAKKPRSGASNASQIVWATLVMALGIQVAQKTKQMKEWEKEREEGLEQIKDANKLREDHISRVRDLVLAEDWISDAAEAVKSSSTPEETLRLKVRTVFDTVALRLQGE